MFYVGQKVRCINDRFHLSIVEWAMNIPVAGEVYTVRHAGFGHHQIDQHAEFCIILDELPNPLTSTGHEIYFAASRFVPLEAENAAQEASECEHEPAMAGS